MGLTVDMLLPRLVHEFGYPPKGAELVAQKLLASTPPVQAEFLNWWHSGKLASALEYEGYSLQRLMEQHRMTPIAAFLTLDWLAREPAKARKSLQKGHDHVA